MKKRFNQLDGLRILCVYSVMFFHTNEFFSFGDFLYIGGAGLFVLLTLSGYLFGYLHGGDYENYSIKDSIASWKSKFKKFYLLHIVTLAMAVFLYNRHGIDNIDKLRVLTNMFLVQIFVPRQDFFHSYNGVSWYLAMLLVVYFFAPLLAYIFRNVKSEKDYILRISACLIIIGTAIFVCGNSDMGIWFTFITPVLYIFEFSIGLLFGKLFAEGQCDFKKVLGSTIIVGIVFTIGLFFKGAILALVPVGIVLCVLVIQLCINSKGIAAKILGGRVCVFLASFSFEVYMFHQMIGKYMVKVQEKTGMGNLLCFVLTIVISLLVSYCWMRIDKMIHSVSLRAKKVV